MARQRSKWNRRVAEWIGLRLGLNGLEQASGSEEYSYTDDGEAEEGDEMAAMRAERDARRQSTTGFLSGDKVFVMKKGVKEFYQQGMPV